MSVENPGLSERLGRWTQIRHWFHAEIANCDQQTTTLEAMLGLALSLGFAPRGVCFRYQGSPRPKLVFGEAKKETGRWQLEAGARRIYLQRAKEAIQGSQPVLQDGVLSIPLHRQEWRNDKPTAESLPVAVISLVGVSKPDLMQTPEFQVWWEIGTLLLARQKRWQESSAQAQDLLTDFTSVEKELQALSHAFHKKYEMKNIIGGKSPAMRSVLELLEKIIPSHSPVLIEGESGTGKELIAKTIHRYSPRSSHPFIAIPCGGLHPSLLESQLFGHVPGAFTGAETSYPGLFMQAHHGSIFLDEISAMPLEAQAKLLRVIQHGDIVPLGASQPQRVDVRVFTASTVSLEQLVREKRFREDLYYRINVISLRLPPLRERREDLSLLVSYFIREVCKRLGAPRKVLTKSAFERLCEFSWPGNVRQLENVLEMMVALHSSRRLDVKHLPPDIQAHDDSNLQKPIRFEKAKEAFMKRYLDGLLSHAKGSVEQAAKWAGVERESFYRLKRRYHL